MAIFVYQDALVIVFQTYLHFSLARRFLTQWSSSLSVSRLGGAFYSFGNFSQSDYSILAFLQSNWKNREYVCRPIGCDYPAVKFVRGSDVAVILPLDVLSILGDFVLSEWMQNEIWPKSFPDGFTYSLSGYIMRRDLKYIRYLNFLNSKYLYDRKK